MSKVARAFEKGKAFIPFVTCGDPSLAVTEELVYAMEEAGADLIELGIPFSDPTAEGPVIQAANMRALAGGVTTDKIFEMVRRIRKRSNIPLVFMTYANVVFSYGTERFVRTAADVGMDGLILPDVPFEEKEEFAEPCRKAGLGFHLVDCPHLPSADRPDCRGSGRICLLCVLHGRHRRAPGNHHGYRQYGAAGKGEPADPLCGGIWNLHTAAGQRNGRKIRRGDCGQRHRPGCARSTKRTACRRWPPM